MNSASLTENPSFLVTASRSLTHAAYTPGRRAIPTPLPAGSCRHREVGIAEPNGDLLEGQPHHFRSGLGDDRVAAGADVGGCAGLPPLADRPSTHALPPAAESPLGRAVLPGVQQRPGLTGVVPIVDGRVAFGTRVRLARVATRSIDVQTFIWHSDATGTLLFEEMMSAAERGVRVRLLLDDLNTVGSDPTLALLASHQNVELRLYNPFVGRGSRALGFLSDFRG